MPCHAPPYLQVLRSRLQQRMDSRSLQYTGLMDVMRKTLQVRHVPQLPGACRLSPVTCVLFVVCGV